MMLVGLYVLHSRHLRSYNPPRRCYAVVSVEDVEKPGHLALDSTPFHAFQCLLRQRVWLWTHLKFQVPLELAKELLILSVLLSC